MFRNKNLNNWREVDGKSGYKVVNEEIVGVTNIYELNSFLAMKKEYGDSILKLEFLLVPNIDSGIRFRSESTADHNNDSVHGYQWK